MKAALFSLALVAGLAVAQSDKIPSCATSCLKKYTTGGGIAGCGQLDIECICSNKEFLNGIACCLQDSCDAAGQEAAVKYAKQICSTAGVTVPDQVTCNKDTSSSSASASAASESASASAASKSASESASAAETKTATDATATAKSATAETSATASGTTGAESSGTATASSGSTSSTSAATAARIDTAGGLLGAVVALLFAL